VAAVATLAAFVLAILGHAALRRAAPRVGSVGGFLLVGALMGAGLAGLLAQRDGLALHSWAALASYAFACELYIFLFSSVSSSVSASFLYRLRSGKPPAVSGTAMVARRLERMLSAGILEKTSSGYRATARGARLLRAYRSLRGFFKRPAYAR
jgi:hypothetical protein